MESDDGYAINYSKSKRGGQETDYKWSLSDKTRKDGEEILKYSNLFQI